MVALEILQNAKLVWDTTHSAGSHTIGNKAGEYYLVMQKNTGDTAFNLGINELQENKDTLDELLVQVAGDVIQGVWQVAKLVTPAGRALGIALDILGVGTDISLGTALKQALKGTKSFLAYNNNDFNWGYVDSSWYDSSRGYQPLKAGEYAKIRTYKDQPHIPAGGFTEFVKVSEAEYYACKDYAVNKEKLIDEIQKN